MIFEIKSDLPIAEQNKIDALLAIPAAQRTTTQVDYLAARLPYQTNLIISLGADGLITSASGLTVPTGYAGFRKGATFIKTDASGNGLYTNTGTDTVAAWDLVDQASTANIDDNSITSEKLANALDFAGKTLANLTIESVTPVNAVAGSKLLTIGTNPIEGATVSVGGVTYKFRVAIGAGVAATGTLAMNTEQPHDGDTVILGNTTYTFKTALTPTAGQVLIDDTTEHSMDNLIAAIEGGAGEGTKYATGTLSQGMVTASKATADTMLVTYESVGFLGNQYDTLGTATHATWGAITLTGGVDAQSANDVLIGGTAEISIDNLVLAITAGAGIGTNYGTGTVANPLATAVKASASTMTATNKVKGVIGNATAIAETLADGSWAAGATFLSGGVDGTVGAAGEFVKDATYLYMCIATNTIADANWRRVALGSAY